MNADQPQSDINDATHAEGSAIAPPIEPVTYKVGGSLSADHPTYVDRPADEELYQTLKEGDYCYIFNARQMGKSSLRVRVMRRLQTEEFVCVAVDLSALARSEETVTATQWYMGLIRKLVVDLRLTEQESSLWVRDWYKARSHLDPQTLLDEFISSVLLAQIQQNIVVFLDEIDSILQLAFARDFMTWIRACFNRRVDDPNYLRLRFVLIGVTTPSDLIADQSITAFNIGIRIDLTGFTMPMAQPLTLGLVNHSPQPEALLTAILSWTGGQPFLTQKVCRLIQTTEATIPTGTEAEWVEQFIHQQLINNWQSGDDPPHLKTVRDRILRSETRASRLLDIYRHILNQNGIREEDVDDGDRMELRLSGLVVLREGRLVVANRIYQAIFNLTWVETELEKLRPYAYELQQWRTTKGDKSYLLRGDDLKHNLEKVGQRSLATEDFQFFLASLTEAKDDYEHKNVFLKKLNRRLSNLTAVLVLTFLGTVLVGLNTYINAKRVEFDRQGLEAQKLFQESDARQLEALLLAVQAGQNWENQPFLQLLKKIPFLSKLYLPPGNLVFALQQSSDQIQQSLILQDPNPANQTLNALRSLSFSPDGKYIAAGEVKEINSRETNILFWRLDNLQTKPEKVLLEGSGQIYNLQFLQLSNTTLKLIATSDDGIMRIWNVVAQPHSTTLKLENQIPIELDKVKPTENSFCGSENTNKTRREALPIPESFSINQTGAIATASWSGKIRIRDLQGREIAKSPVETQNFQSIIFRHDILITGAGNGTIQLWRVQDQDIVPASSPLTAHQRAITALSLSPDEQWLATTSNEDCKTRLWKMQDLRQSQSSQPIELIGFERGAWQVGFSPDSKMVAAVSHDGTARLWQLDGLPIKQFEVSNHSDQSRDVYALSFNPIANRQELATASTNGKITFWKLDNLQTGKSTHRSQGVQVLKVTQSDQTDQHSSVYGVRFTSTDLVTASKQGVELWQQPLIKTGSEKRSLLSRSRTLIFSFSLQANSTQTGWLVTPIDKNKLQVWDWQSGIFQHDRKLSLEALNSEWGYISSVSVNPKGEVAVAFSKGWIGIWTLQGRLQAQPVHAHSQSGKENIFNIKFSPDGGQIITASKDGTAQLWQRSNTWYQPWQQVLQTLHLKKKLCHSAYAPASWQIVLPWNWGYRRLINPCGYTEVFSANFSPDGKTLVTAARDGSFAFWDESGSQKLWVDAHPEPIFSAEFNPMGTQLATASSDGTVRLWNLEGQQLATFQGHQGSVYDLSFNWEGTQLASASEDGTVRIWKVETSPELVQRGCKWLENYLDNQSINEIKMKVGAQVHQTCKEHYPE